MRLSAPVLSVLACLSVSASASPSERENREATKIFWSYSKCVVDHARDKATLLLNQREWSQEDCMAAVKLAQSRSECVPPGSKLSFSPVLFRGSVAGAAFVKSRRGQPLPNYAQNPPAFAFPTQAEAVTPSGHRAMLLAFAGCVFRNRPEDVRRILETRPFSAEENVLWEQIGQDLGTCLPAEDGVQLRFSRVSLRGLLGEAAYAEDNALNEQGNVGIGALH
jgi:hypothetical protein